MPGCRVDLPHSRRAGMASPFVATRGGSPRCYVTCVSKAFTRENDDAGIEPVPSSRAVPHGAFRLTREGARKLASDEDPLVREALRRAEIVEVTERAPERAALG